MQWHLTFKMHSSFHEHFCWKNYFSFMGILTSNPIISNAISKQESGFNDGKMWLRKIYLPSMFCNLLVIFYFSCLKSVSNSTMGGIFSKEVFLRTHFHNKKLSFTDILWICKQIQWGRSMMPLTFLRSPMTSITVLSIHIIWAPL